MLPLIATLCPSPPFKKYQQMVRIQSLCLAVLVFIVFSATSSFAQIKFKLQWLEDSLAWGVFITPEEGFNPSLNTAVGSGQVTVVAPKGSEFHNFQLFSGTWAQNAYVPAPKENPGKDYISFGFVKDDPAIELQAGEETLLFTFSPKNGDCPKELYLIEEGDPFMVFPNSANANPGNEISIFDVNTRSLYHYVGNYAPEAWNCHPGKTVKQGPYRIGDAGKKNKRFNRP